MMNNFLPQPMPLKVRPGFKFLCELPKGLKQVRLEAKNDRILVRDGDRLVAFIVGNNVVKLA